MRNKREVREKAASQALRAVLYIRVSSEHQKKSGLSLEDQETRLVAWAKANGVEDYVVLVDAAESGKKVDRDEYQRGLAMLDSGERNILVSLKLDRIARNTREALDLRDRVGQGAWNVVVLDGAVQFDTRTANGKLMLTMFAALAEWEADVNSERTTAALDHKRTTGESGIISNELSAEIVELVRAQGLNGAARVLNDRGTPTSRGGDKWHASTVQRVIDRHEKLQGLPPREKRSKAKTAPQTPL